MSRIDEETYDELNKYGVERKFLELTPATARAREDRSTNLYLQGEMQDLEGNSLCWTDRASQHEPGAPGFSEVPGFDFQKLCCGSASNTPGCFDEFFTREICCEPAGHSCARISALMASHTVVTSNIYSLLYGGVREVTSFYSEWDDHTKANVNFFQMVTLSDRFNFLVDAIKLLQRNHDLVADECPEVLVLMEMVVTGANLDRGESLAAVDEISWKSMALVGHYLRKAEKGEIRFTRLVEKLGTAFEETTGIPMDEIKSLGQHADPIFV